MKSFLDFEEKNVEKAVQKACADLKIARDKLKYDIISHGSSGIFGLVGTKKALIRVFVPELPNGKPGAGSLPAGGQTDNNFDDNTIQSERDSVNALVDEAFGEVTEPVKPKVKPGKKPRTEKAMASDKEEKPKKEMPVETKTPIDQEKSAGPTDAENKLNTEAAIAVAQELVREIFKTMDVDAQMSVASDSNQCLINVKVAEPGILIGKRGQTLEAIQYLVDKVVNKQCGKGNRVIFDVEGYVESRKTELQDLASRLANKAVKTGKPSTMTRMNAHDRRIVHVSLKKNRSVRTQSVGDGYYRKLIIFPKKKTAKKTDNVRAKK